LTGLLRFASEHQPNRAEKEQEMNSVNLVGRLTKDPELSERGKTKVCDLRIAVNGQGESPPCYIDVAAFKAQAEACAKYLGKGSQVAVSGAIRYSEWKKDGSKRSKHSVLAREVRFLDPRPEGEEEQAE
jgi:single-strand DNA-binding protein